MSIFIPAPEKSTFVASNLRKRNFAGSDTLFVGSTPGSSAIFRTLLKFDVRTIPKHSLLGTATLRMFLKRNDYPARVKIFDIHLLTERFKPSEVAWKNQPCFDPEIEISAEVNQESGAFIEWDITKLVQRWRAKGSKNRGIIIKSRDEAQGTLTAFDSGDSPHVDRRPNIIVTLQETVQSLNQIAHFFISDVQQDLPTTDDFQYSLPRDISTVFFHTFFIQNKGANPVTVVAQISPDNTGSTWMDDSTVSLVNAGENFAITSTHPAKWTRLAFKSAHPGSPSVINVWFQSET